ncbi:hypothetical protein BTE48_15855, partial [Oceanospirillum multiglobuliferum]
MFRPIQPDLEQKFSGTGANAADTAAFIKDNMNNPNALYEFIQQKGLGFGLVAELFDGMREEDVAGFFGSHGLGPGLPPKPPVDGQPPLPPIDGQPGGNPPPPPPGPVFRPIQPDLEQKFSGTGANAADTAAFIKDNMNNPNALYEFIQQKGLGFGLVAELFDGIREEDVAGFFGSHGLGPGQPPKPPVDGQPPLPPIDGQPPLPPIDGQPPLPPIDGQPPLPPIDGQPPLPPIDGQPGGNPPPPPPPGPVFRPIQPDLEQ